MDFEDAMEKRPDTMAAHRLRDVAELVGDEMDRERAERAVDYGLLPDGVLDRKYLNDAVSGYLSGFRNAIGQVEDSQYTSRTVEEELLRVEHDLTDKINAIDHSGRGSGCCQSEAGLKKKREAVRWVLLGQWGISN